MTVPPEAEALIDGASVMAHLATCVDGRPHVAPVWYGYHDGIVEILTTGRKLANIRENPRVAISIQQDEGGEAQWMVSLLGTATVIEDPEERVAAAERIYPKYSSDSSEYPENLLVRIDIGNATFKTY